MGRTFHGTYSDASPEAHTPYYSLENIVELLRLALDLGTAVGYLGAPVNLAKLRPGDMCQPTRRTMMDASWKADANDEVLSVLRLAYRDRRRFAILHITYSISGHHHKCHRHEPIAFQGIFIGHPRMLLAAQLRGAGQ